MKLNENIRKFRQFRKMSQAQLATQMSKSKSVISHWENGENSPDLDSCEKLCRVLNVTPNELFGWEPNREYEKFLEEMNLLDQEINIIENQKKALDDKLNKLLKKKYDASHPDWLNYDDSDGSNSTNFF